MVDKVLDSHMHHGKLQYLLNMKGYGPQKDSWEPEENIHAPRLTREFQKFLQKSGPKTSRERPGRRGVLPGLGLEPGTSSVSGNDSFC